MKSVLLIGLGEFGRNIAAKLCELNHEVMGIDINEERVNEAMDYVTNAQIGDSTNAEFLETLGVDEYDLIIVAIGKDFQSSLETTSLIKEMGGHLVVSRAESDTQEKFLLRNGADQVVYPEKQVARWTAIRFTYNHVLDFIELDDEHSIIEVEVPDNWIGRTIGNMDVRRQFGITVLALKEQGKKMNVVVRPDMTLCEGMTMLVLGEQKALRKCFKT